MTQEKDYLLWRCKTCTDIPQSEALSKILSLDSADMCYIKHSSSDNSTWEFNEDFPPIILGNAPIKEITVETLPCWSLSALLNILPSATLDSSDDHYYRFYCMERFTEWYDNAIDACVAMIEKLHKLKML